jgi:filamentous hemagglutinin family protein
MKYTPDYSSRFRILKGGKISLVVSALVAGSTMSFASPTGGQVSSGSAAIAQNGSITTINQSSNKASINWNSFSIAPSETVNFVQPSASSVTLNRVVGTTQSLIQGAMNANGQVFLLNPNGVLFAHGSQINVGGLVASTLNITDANFQAGNYLFEGNSQNSIINMGTITANNGYVAMMGKTVQNEGTIVATMGNVQLASGEKISLNLNGNSLVKLTIDQGTLNALIENKGLIQADGGQVYLTTQALNTILNGMVNNTGVIEANSIDDVKGKVVLTSDHIMLSADSIITATGAKGGGEVLVGGDWQGSSGVYQAQTVTMEAGSTIDASATDKGDGGKVVLWSTNTTDFAGSIKATGAGVGGNGGKAEVSGKTLLNYTGNTNLLGGTGGKTGDLLLDPYNLYITAGTGGSLTAGGNDSILGATTLETALSTANVTISTGSSGTQTGNIGILSGITSAFTNSLTLTAAGNIVVDSNINLGGALIVQPTGNFVMGANLTTGVGVDILASGGFTKTGTGTSYLTGKIVTNNAAINITGPVQVGSFDVNSNPVELNSNGGAITLSGAISAFSGTNLQAYTSVMAQNMFDGAIASGVGTATTMSITFGTAGNRVFIPLWGMSEAVDYLVIGGGGGRGYTVTDYSGGGGGAGGVASGSMTLTGGTVYSMTIGAAGITGYMSGGTNADGSDKGGDTSFNGILSGGGGAGGGYWGGSGSAGRGGVGYTAGGGGGGSGGSGNNSTYGIGGVGGTGSHEAAGKVKIQVISTTVHLVVAVMLLLLEQ